MSLGKVIDMVLCPACDKEYIQAGAQDICKKCTPRYEISLSLQSIYEAIKLLEMHRSAFTKEQEVLLIDVQHKLTKLSKGET